MTELDQLEFDYDEIDVEDRGFVKERAEKIRETAKRTAQGIIQIGQWLTEVKRKLDHGQWYPWLHTEFGWSVDTAQRLMNVTEFVKSRNLRHLEIDVSALYLIAAPKTPEPVVQEVIRRAEAGEPMTHAKAKEVLEDYRSRNENPTPAVARQIALATDTPVAANTNVYVLPMTAADEAVLEAEQTKIRGIYTAIETIVNANITPEEMVGLGAKYYCRSLAPWSAQAAKWLEEVAKEAYEQTKQTAVG